ncbi:hypothetical protein Dacet_0641 [Denitrovibrio acetiphilus DSM 12809]|uniref:Uncharacterized protein n=1 Tax=Denitrovibrio acetiphilus (strain DSM 12809 / NBRC 114555 / N2460) TaxID=522772 RepID=D4H4N6_DENA2|nr:hypothetical protein [Denitrovibrio acetiphilus]ADD67430.1 hypothetical protein Dacet_0641 [Denitrovibrio acetiphilus DSM 12809]
MFPLRCPTGKRYAVRVTPLRAFNTYYQEGYANYPHQHIKLQRGQLLTTESTLMKDFGWKKSRLRTFFDKLQNDHMINKESDNKKTIITICNYDKFQPAISVLRNAIQTADRLENDKHYNKNNNKLNNSKKADDDTIQEFLHAYNSNCGDSFGYVNPETISKRSMEAVSLAISTLDSKQTTPSAYFKTCLIDKHLTGQKHDGFRPTFMYLLKPETIESTLMINQLEMSLNEFDESFNNDPIATNIFENATDAINSQKSQLLRYIKDARERNISDQEILDFFANSSLSFTTTLIDFSELIYR